MGRIRRTRFLALSTIGLLATGVSALAGAQVGVDLSATGPVVAARVEGLRADGASLSAGHGVLGSVGEPVTVVNLRDVGIRSACIHLRSVDVPVLGAVTVVAELPEGAEVSASGLTIDARSLGGPLQLEDIVVGRGAVDPGERMGRDGVGLTAGSLYSDGIDVDVAGLRAERLRTSEIRVRAVRGEGSC